MCLYSQKSCGILPNIHFVDVVVDYGRLDCCNTFETLKSPFFLVYQSTTLNHNLFLHSKMYSVQCKFSGWLHLLSLKAFLEMEDSPLFHSMGMHEHTDVKARLPSELHHHSV